MARLDWVLHAATPVCGLCIRARLQAYRMSHRFTGALAPESESSWGKINRILPRGSRELVLCLKEAKPAPYWILMDVIRSAKEMVGGNHQGLGKSTLPHFAPSPQFFLDSK